MQEAGDKALTADEVKAYGLPTAEAGKVWVKVNTDTLVTDSEGNIHQDGLAMVITTWLRKRLLIVIIC